MKYHSIIIYPYQLSTLHYNLIKLLFCYQNPYLVIQGRKVKQSTQKKIGGLIFFF